MDLISSVVSSIVEALALGAVMQFLSSVDSDADEGDACLFACACIIAKRFAK